MSTEYTFQVTFLQKYTFQIKSSLTTWKNHCMHDLKGRLSLISRIRLSFFEQQSDATLLIFVLKMKD